MAHPGGHGWESKAVLPCSVQVPATIRHIFESLLCAVTTSVGGERSLNVRLWDVRFYKDDYKVPPSGVLKFPESVTKHVRNGGTLPSRTDSATWLNLFQDVVPGVSAYWLFMVACGLWREQISKPYLAAHPIHPNAWDAGVPAPLNDKKVRLGKRRKALISTEAEDDHLEDELSSFGVGSLHIRRNK